MTARLRHLTTLEHLPRATIEHLLERAMAMREACAHGTGKLDTLAGRTVLNLFLEPSTRTRTSFELAARRLGADVVNFDIGHSSTAKGEALPDTLHTLEAMQLDAIIVRHALAGTADQLAQWAMSAVSVINAGDGDHAHPTQGLLDALTIYRHGLDFANLTVTICGDIAHSRVAHSDVHALRTLGTGEIRLCGPEPLLPAPAQYPSCHVTEDFDRAIAGANVVIMLRLQKERMSASEVPDVQAYFRHYGLNRQRLARADKGCLVMHPGPINRETEIASEIADGAQSCILEQVTNGVFMRMAVLDEMLAR